MRVRGAHIHTISRTARRDVFLKEVIKDEAVDDLSCFAKESLPDGRCNLMRSELSRICAVGKRKEKLCQSVSADQSTACIQS